MVVQLDRFNLGVM